MKLINCNGCGRLIPVSEPECPFCKIPNKAGLDYAIRQRELEEQRLAEQRRIEEQQRLQEELARNKAEDERRMAEEQQRMAELYNRQQESQVIQAEVETTDDDDIIHAEIVSDEPHTDAPADAYSPTTNTPDRGSTAAAGSDLIDYNPTDAAEQYTLGMRYFNGNGVQQSYTEAARWFAKAANQRDSWAQYGLGLCYEEGLGVVKDTSEAVDWYRTAANQGNSFAQYRLAFCLENGIGTSVDKSEALMWYRYSANQGNTDAQQALYELQNGSNNSHSFLYTCLIAIVLVVLIGILASTYRAMKAGEDRLDSLRQTHDPTMIDTP